MNRYDYKFNTVEGIKTITVKGKGIKQAIKEELTNSKSKLESRFINGWR